MIAFLLWFISFNDPGMTEFTDPRDGNRYPVVRIDDLLWFQENLRYRTATSLCIGEGEPHTCEECGSFYLVEEAMGACPEGWRLPKTKEVQRLIRASHRERPDPIASLRIKRCGRGTMGRISSVGEENTFWMDAELKDGHVMHWHLFEDHDLHSHDVVNAQRQFPVRCVCEVTKDR